MSLVVDDDVLAGGGQNYGRLRRRGAGVVRPVGAHSPYVHSFLRYLRSQGFDGAPEVLRGWPTEEVLGFIDGDVPGPPEPPAGGWPVVSADRAASVGGLLSHFHRAAHSFVPAPDARWNGGSTPGVEPLMICHNDPVVGNVVFQGETAMALIDFDFAGPNDPIRDIAIAAQHWVPLADPADLVEAPSIWDPGERLRAMCQTYGLAGTSTPRLLDLVDDYLLRGREGVLARVKAGRPRFVAYWEAGLGDRLGRALTWLRSERPTLA